MSQHLVFAVAVAVSVLIGWGVGVPGSTSILLPVFWAWPKVRQLGREGRLVKPVPIRTFLVSPLLWVVLIAASLLLVLWAVPSMIYGYLLGLTGAFSDTWRLVSNPNEHMEADFADRWAAYLRNDVATVLRILANLVAQPELPESDAPRVLQWELPDSRFRYMMFCLSTVHFVCARRMNDPNAILDQCVDRVIDFATGVGADGLFKEAVEKKKVTDEGVKYLTGFFNQWAAWLQVTRSDPTNARGIRPESWKLL